MVLRQTSDFAFSRAPCFSWFWLLNSLLISPSDLVLTKRAASKRLSVSDGSPNSGFECVKRPRSWCCNLRLWTDKLLCFLVVVCRNAPSPPPTSPVLLVDVWCCDPFVVALATFLNRLLRKFAALEARGGCNWFSRFLIARKDIWYQPQMDYPNKERTKVSYWRLAELPQVVNKNFAKLVMVLMMIDDLTFGISLECVLLLNTKQTKFQQYKYTMWIILSFKENLKIIRKFGNFWNKRNRKWKMK